MVLKPKRFSGVIVTAKKINQKPLNFKEKILLI